MTCEVEGGCSREHGVRNGNLDLMDWDRAVVEHIGAVLEPENPSSPTNPGKNLYYLPLGGIFVYEQGDRFEIERAQVVYKRPSPTDISFILPEIVISREDFTPTKERLFGVTEQYRLPAEGATKIAVNGCVGYSNYVTKDQEDPYDFTYTIEVWSKYRAVAQMLLGMMLVKFPVRGAGKVAVTDSLGCVREYLAFNEGTADLTEVNSMVDRIAGYSLNIRIEGELTAGNVEFCTTAFTGETSPTPPTGEPEVPPADRYATGAADVELCFKGESYKLAEDEQFPA